MAFHQPASPPIEGPESDRAGQAQRLSGAAPYTQQSGNIILSVYRDPDRRDLCPEVEGYLNGRKKRTDPADHAADSEKQSERSKNRDPDLLSQKR